MNSNLKFEVKNYWNDSTCGTSDIKQKKFTKEYFDEIENIRYSKEPEILEFADFKSGKNKKVLEVGLGAGTDFINWIRNGAQASGIDLTPESISHVKHRLELEGLKADGLYVGDCEELPFENEVFDIVYSWGVIHHTPNTIKALDEIIRVLKPGGTAKIMVYNRKSILAIFFWIKHAFLKFQWNLSVADVLYNKMESIGTKAYTTDEIEKILVQRKLKNINVGTFFTYYDRLERFSILHRLFSKVLSVFLGKKHRGWFLTFQFTK